MENIGTFGGARARLRDHTQDTTRRTGRQVRTYVGPGWVEKEMAAQVKKAKPPEP